MKCSFELALETQQLLRLVMKNFSSVFGSNSVPERSGNSKKRNRDCLSSLEDPRGKRCERGALEPNSARETCHSGLQG